MKFLSPLVLMTACGLLAAPVFAADAPPLTGCAAKRQDISTQIEQAKANGKSDQQAGLEKALSEVTANCTDASLLKELENKVLDAKSEVSRRQKDLDKAVSKGDPDKINKRKDKLAEARQDLKDAHAELEKIEPDDD
ncbi:DUF1090 domain-containing protein [Pseudomonas sp.]|jgi:hypothetical protein|uniref:DUF1090 domain-containing protein n=1 Tax=Pseudomonas sp. TaxID=306 RepID=UPI00260F5656|nr:DUF1090 domain-containing protein [Pseudomonas sp.]